MVGFSLSVSTRLAGAEPRCRTAPLQNIVMRNSAARMSISSTTSSAPASAFLRNGPARPTRSAPKRSALGDVLATADAAAGKQMYIRAGPGSLPHLAGSHQALGRRDAPVGKRARQAGADVPSARDASRPGSTMCRRPRHVDRSHANLDQPARDLAADAPAYFLDDDRPSQPGTYLLDLAQQARASLRRLPAVRLLAAG